MEEVILRFPYLGEKIFDSLSNKNLQKSKKVARSWQRFVNNQKFPWIRIIINYLEISNKNIIYAANSKLLKNVFKTTRLDVIRKFAENIHKEYKDFPKIQKNQTLMHFITNYPNAFENEQERFELFKKVLREEKQKNPKDFIRETPLHFAAKV